MTEKYVAVFYNGIRTSDKWYMPYPPRDTCEEVIRDIERENKFEKFDFATFKKVFVLD